MRYVPPDPAHRYTIGEHSIRMVAHLERLLAGIDPGEAAICRPGAAVLALRCVMPGGAAP